MTLEHKQRSMVGVILAAGRGTRMSPFSSKLPKPIMPICNRPLMAYQIDIMREVGIREVFIVIGHLGHEIVRAMGDGRQYGMHFTYLEQAQKLGIAHALIQLEPHIHSPFLLFLGDIYFQLHGLQELAHLCHRHSGGSHLFTKEEPDPEAIKRNFAVFTDPETGFVRRVIEKPRYVRNNLKGCGIYLFDLPIFDALRRTPRTAMRDEYEITEAIQILIDDGEPVHVANLVKEDINLTYPYDILRCNMAELNLRKQDYLIDETAEVDSHADIHMSVIGSNARIGGPVSMRNCVVLDGGTIKNAHYQLSHCVITPDTTVDCRMGLAAA